MQHSKDDPSPRDQRETLQKIALAFKLPCDESQSVPEMVQVVDTHLVALYRKTKTNRDKLLDTLQLAELDHSRIHNQIDPQTATLLRKEVHHLELDLRDIQNLRDQANGRTIEPLHKVSAPHRLARQTLPP